MILPLLCLALCAPAPATGEMKTPVEDRATPRAEVPAPPPSAAAGPRDLPRGDPQRLEARGPGAVFESIEAAAVDALTYTYQQAQAARNAELMRGGTIHASDAGYSYGEIHVAKPSSAHRITYNLGTRDVARFAIYPRDSDYSVNRANERPSRVDRRSVSVIDPLHRPLYILHPSLAIRVYRGEGHELSEVANLRRPARALRLFVEN
jgi:hypothetical protein